MKAILSIIYTIIITGLIACSDDSDPAKKDTAYSDNANEKTDNSKKNNESEKKLSLDEIYQSFKKDYKQSLKDLVLHTRDRGGLPIKNKQFWHFSNIDEKLYLSGEFNEWSSSDDYLMNKVTSEDGKWFLYHYKTETAISGKYKFYAKARNVYYADPFAANFDPFDKDPSGNNVEISLTEASNWRRMIFYYDGNIRQVKTFFPKPAENNENSLLLMMFDGQNLFTGCSLPSCWDLDKVISEAGTNAIISGIFHGENKRIEEYSFVKQKVGETEITGTGEMHLKWIMETVRPELLKRYQLSEKNLAVGGSSLGGLMTLRTWQKYSDKIKFAAAFSSTLSFGGDPGDSKALLVELEKDLSLDASTPKLFLYTGGNVNGECKDEDNDGLKDDSDDQDNYCTNLQLVDILKSKGWAEDKEFFFKHQPDAKHDEATWSWAFKNFLLPWLEKN